jgi:hypothetical protein
MVILAIKTALENIDKNYCKLSQIDYSMLRANESTKKFLEVEKYLERPIAYEFYHQLRKLINCGDVNFGGPVIQAEVDKKYQKCFENGKIPDFIIHVPSTRKNLAVIELKLASNFRNLEGDLKKLVEFKNNQDLEYAFAIEIIIGNHFFLNKAKEKILKMEKARGEEIIIIDYNTDSRRVKDWKILVE